MTSDSKIPPTQESTLFNLNYCSSDSGSTQGAHRGPPLRVAPTRTTSDIKEVKKANLLNAKSPPLEFKYPENVHSPPGIFVGGGPGVHHLSVLPGGCLLAH
jgi:hypothetical protein